VYAHAIEGLDAEKVEELDAILTGNGDGPPADTKAKARREREAVEAALRANH
jgi:hypothetical protein